MVELRKTLLLPLDDLLVVVRDFIHRTMLRSALNRLLVRHQIGNLNDFKPKFPKSNREPLKVYESGYTHMDIKYLPKMADDGGHSCLFMAIRRASRWVCHQIMPNKTAACASAFFDVLKEPCPIRIQTIMTDCLVAGAVMLPVSISLIGCAKHWMLSIA